MKTFVSDVSGKRYPVSEKVSAKSVRNPVLKLIREEHPDFDISNALSLKELNIYREKYIANYLSREVDKLSDMEKKVLDSMADHSVISDNPDEEADRKTTVAERTADKVASFGGSWTFIIIFIAILVGWIIFNAVWLMNKGFDPYPFILLNLLLSCLAAMQAPIIMMSQNRQADKDRERSKKDYMVNLKSELEIRTLHEKLDHLMMYQQQELIEIQKIQIDMLTDILKQVEKRKT